MLPSFLPIELNKLKPCDTTDEVARSGNTYALDSEGHLIALHVVGDIALKRNNLSITLKEETQSLVYLAIRETQKVVGFAIEVSHPHLSQVTFFKTALHQFEIKAACDALAQLWLSKNALEVFDIGENAPNLHLLDVGGNNLPQLDLKTQDRLAYCFAPDNQIVTLTIPEKLPHLKHLDLRNNRLETLPFALGNSNALVSLLVGKNALTEFDRSKVAEDDRGNSVESIMPYLRSLLTDEVVPYDQVKLIVLGNSTAGKSSLLHFLKDGTYDKNRPTTHGMIPTLWQPDENDPLKIALWDFGGQEYYHNVHHLFFTHNTLYLVLFDANFNQEGKLETKLWVYKDGKKQEEIQNLRHFPYQYWMHTIEYLLHGKKLETADHNKTATTNDLHKYCWLFENKTDLNPYTLSHAHYRLSVEKSYEKDEEFIHDFIAFKTKLINTLKALNGKIPFSKKWLEIKEFILKESENKNYLDKQELLTKAQEIKPDFSEQDLNSLLETLINSGVVLYFPNTPSLADKIIIRPDWLVDQIHRILDVKVQENGGRISMENIQEKPDHIDGNFGHEKLLEIMRQFDLIYEINKEINFNSEYERYDYIAPQYLGDENEEIKKSIKRMKEDKCNNIPTFYIRYPNFIPVTTLPRFIARYGKFATDNCWENGMLFTYKETDILIEQIPNENKIVAWIQETPSKNECINKVFNDLISITMHPEMRLSLDGKEWVLISQVLDEKFPNDYYETDEKGWIQRKHFAPFMNGYHPPIPFKNVSDETRVVKIFLASSEELKEHREFFEIEINRLNKDWVPNKKIFFHLEIWEDFLDHMQINGLQNKYNEMIKNEVGIFVLLCWTKVGKYTLSEFETAWGTFEENKTRPLVYVFRFGHPYNPNKQDFDSLHDFMKKVEELKHFYTKYENKHDLAKRMSEQIRKLFEPDPKENEHLFLSKIKKQDLLSKRT